MTDKNKKVTVKMLSEEIVNLKQLHTNEINFLKDKFAAFEKSLESRIEVLENAKNARNLDTYASVENFQFKCKECSMTFDKKCELKKHISSLHPRNYPCKICEQTFESRITRECHF